MRLIVLLFMETGRGLALFVCLCVLMWQSCSRDKKHRACEPGETNCLQPGGAGTSTFFRRRSLAIYNEHMLHTYQKCWRTLRTWQKDQECPDSPCLTHRYLSFFLVIFQGNYLSDKLFSLFPSFLLALDRKHAHCTLQLTLSGLFNEWAIKINGRFAEG